MSTNGHNDGAPNYGAIEKGQDAVPPTITKQNAQLEQRVDYGGYSPYPQYPTNSAYSGSAGARNVITPVETNHTIVTGPPIGDLPPYIMGEGQPIESSDEEKLASMGLRPRGVCEAYLLWFPLGLLGAHHFYLKRYHFGVLYFFTLGLCGVGWLVDGCRMYCLVKESNRKLANPDELHPLSLADAYILWFPLGLLGFHHYYLRNYSWAITYTYTAGLFGIGWLVDSVRMPCLVKEANKCRELNYLVPDKPRNCKLGDAYLLGMTPAGLFGAHQFYMGRCEMGIFYMITCADFGIGWIVDWMRMTFLVDRANHPEKHTLGHRHKYVDDAYITAFPLGIFGAHYFYLEKPGWGALYCLTLGLFGIGWLVDLFRMPCLVAEANKDIEEEEMRLTRLRELKGLPTRGGVIIAQQTTVRTNNGGDGGQGHDNPAMLVAPPPYSSVYPNGGNMAIQSADINAQQGPVDTKQAMA